MHRDGRHAALRSGRIRQANEVSSGKENVHVFFGDEPQVGVKTLRGRRGIDDALVGLPIGIRLTGNAETHVFTVLLQFRCCIQEPFQAFVRPNEAEEQDQLRCCRHVQLFSGCVP